MKALGKIDYLALMKNDRHEKKQPQKPYDWKDIIQRSKIVSECRTNKEPTYITHMRDRSIDNTQLKSDITQKKEAKNTEDSPRKKKS